MTDLLKLLEGYEGDMQPVEVPPEVLVRAHRELVFLRRAVRELEADLGAWKASARLAFDPVHRDQVCCSCVGLMRGVLGRAKVALEDMSCTCDSTAGVDEAHLHEEWCDWRKAAKVLVYLEVKP